LGGVGGDELDGGRYHTVDRTKTFELAFSLSTAK
jgi:hypothetical protein